MVAMMSTLSTSLATVEGRSYQFRASRPPVDDDIVFVVDDDTSVRTSLELLFETAGWQCETFESAPEFLARTRPTVPSCMRKMNAEPLPDLVRMETLLGFGFSR
jgi:hypothetical protein